MNLPHSLDRTLLIHAHRDIVFSILSETPRWAKWWGGGSIDPKPGGKVSIVYPGGVEVAGEVVAIDPPHSISFTYGFVSGKPIPAGSSLVSIELKEASNGTTLHFRHDFAEPVVRDEHVQGWRYQLSVFANLAANMASVGYGDAVATWCAAWSIADSVERAKVLEEIATIGLGFRDRYSAIEGRDEVCAQLGAFLRFMPGAKLVARGGLRHCQGMVLADWAAVNAEGKDLFTGTNVYEFNVDGKIDRVTGLANG